MYGCQNLNSRRASRGDYEKVVNQYPPFLGVFMDFFKHKLRAAQHLG